MSANSQLQTQADFNNVGRIHRDAYLGSVSTLFAVCWVAAAVRFHIRLGILRSFAWDDVFLIVGLVCMTTMYALLVRILDDAYATAATLEPNGLTLALRPGFLPRLFNYKKMIDVVLMLAWASSLCVKMSYLFLFRRLIDRVRYMGIYWWFVFVYIIGTGGYIFSVYYLVCPYYDSFAAIQCITGDGITRTVRYTISQIVLDIIGDLFILVFPFYILYTIKIQPKQKLGLAVSLCLTIVIIAMSIIRVAGIITPDNKLDQLWDGYWNIISAEVGLIMTSATAFRALYVSKSGSSSGRRQQPVNTDSSAANSSTSRISRFTSWWRRTFSNSSKSNSNDVSRANEKNVSGTPSDSSWSNNSKHNFPIQANVSHVPSNVISQWQREPPNTMVSFSDNSETAHTFYTDKHESISPTLAQKLRMSEMFVPDPWDYAPPTDHVDKDLLTKRALIEAACKTYRRDTGL